MLDTSEFKSWSEQLSNLKKALEADGFKDSSVETVETPFIPIELFPLASKKAWLDCLLQLLKVFFC